MKEIYSLKDLAEKKGIFIGAAVNPRLIKEDIKYREILEREFNMFTPENAMKIRAVHAKEDEYNFNDADKIVDFAKKNNAKVRGHTLIWGRSLPDWIKEIKNPNQVKNVLVDHVNKVASHFKGNIYAWDVVNEAFGDGGELDHNSWWFKNIGKEYIELAFRIAHEADSNTKLFYNEWGIEISNKKSNTVYEYIKELLGKGVPIHGIGFQMHIGLGKNEMAEDVPVKEELYVNLKRFSDLGLEIHITEMDVQVQGIQGSLEEKLETQANVYKEVLETALKIKNFKALVQWGVTDKDSWIFGLTGNKDSPLIFNNNYLPKAAYYAIKSVLEKK